MQLRSLGGLGAPPAARARGRSGGGGGRAATVRAAASSSIVGVERSRPPRQEQQQRRHYGGNDTNTAAPPPPPPATVLSGASSGASARQGPLRPGKRGMEDAHVLAALTPCTAEAGAAAAAAANENLLSSGGGVALARLGPRAGLRVPLSPAAAAAAALGASSSSSSYASADDGDGSSNNSNNSNHLLMAGVFDGHAGHHTARQAALHLPRLVHAALVREQTALLRRGRLGRLRGGSSSSSSSSANLPPQLCLAGGRATAEAAEAALALAFPAFDRWWADARCDPALTHHGWDDSGATAVVALIAGDRLVVANAGDSVALLVRPSSSPSSLLPSSSPSSPSPTAPHHHHRHRRAFVTRLTVEHRADNEEEAARVLSAGGRILSHVGPGGSMRQSPSPSASASYEDDAPPAAGAAAPRPPPARRPRVSGTSANTRYRSAAVTRALGDFAFKRPHPLLTPEPHVLSVLLEKGDDLLLLASDGVTDALSDGQVAEVALAAARRERRRLEAAVGALGRGRTRGGGAGAGAGVSVSAAAAALPPSSLPDAELRRALRQAVARAAADAVVREAHARGSGDDATCVAVFLDWHEEEQRPAARHEGGGVVLPSLSSRGRR